jgi:hypothetical protein
VDRREWRDAFGRVLEVTRYFGAGDYWGSLQSPSGGLLAFLEDKDRARLVARLKGEAKKRVPTDVGDSMLEKDGELFLPRPSDAHSRDLTEFDLAVIEQYEVKQLRESTLGLRINNRLVLAMVREIRRHRAGKPVGRKKTS